MASGSSLHTTTSVPQRERRGMIENDAISFADDRDRRDITDTDSVCFAGGDSYKENVSSNDLLYTYMMKASDRLNSFLNCRWTEFSIEPLLLARAGFYYTNISDKCKCFRCGIVIGDWNFTDDAWEEHAFWSPKCNFVLDIKGAGFVDSIKRKWTQHLKILKSSRTSVGDLISIFKEV